MFEVSTYHNFEILINPLLLLRAEILQIYVEYSSLNQKYLGYYTPPHILGWKQQKSRQVGPFWSLQTSTLLLRICFLNNMDLQFLGHGPYIFSIL